MHPDERRTANLLGAAALAVSELMLAGATAAAGTSESGASALVVLSGAPGLSVTELGRRVGLSQPAAARMVDSLEGRGLVERRQTVGRWVAVHLTGAGRAAAGQILDSRGGRLTELVRELDERERAALDGALGTLLTRLYGTVGNARLLCRLCDVDVCVENDHTCPVGAAERAERGEA
ncbi:MarR family winged helix-turn-helix transcriptional regulator [Prauserella muralis]|uniref:MarR family transcriptional regulator n=1 Tax=Prauserella muralis TaxID=588067 RepID=A0A2V4AL62_9PSEU|nr:MarR family transcriptional regulator [Prauserella muralis]PXY21025.1 MarR family transcriptional regulator [Prauserella muralis]TWE30097.1 DNA-binding MarR family transcriptional regulator [Prauserella muralis]